MLTHGLRDQRWFGLPSASTTARITPTAFGRDTRWEPGKVPKEAGKGQQIESNRLRSDDGRVGLRSLAAEESPQSHRVRWRSPGGYKPA